MEILWPTVSWISAKTADVSIGSTTRVAISSLAEPCQCFRRAGPWQYLGLVVVKYALQAFMAFVKIIRSSRYLSNISRKRAVLRSFSRADKMRKTTMLSAGCALYQFTGKPRPFSTHLKSIIVRSWMTWTFLALSSFPLGYTVFTHGEPRFETVLQKVTDHETRHKLIAL